ncbi:hypothetical protein CEUSTIGMA_g11897.t1 [Chlamydomonas eustigma]|uniref:VWFA domain-containing protein n=1 Tax=Chlamydomonas eustigma TaxID=1157962 RepID=A0A250XN29_9CHLO|nr:hypothetical protein CEUSTIGMA_g11897.t1 [Chlamydomonas eustigma]|eukprot:GAX84477.1 hypothetical protein CEUSTIGMA_g11897.t1 [Chlamydomonas eustigma]
MPINYHNNNAAVTHFVASTGGGNQRNNMQDRFSVVNQQGQLLHGQLVYNMTSAERPPPKIVVHASFLIDASGSMSWRMDNGESRMAAALRNVKSLVESVLVPDTDRVTLTFFNGRANRIQVFYNTKASKILLSFDRIQDEAKKAMNCSTGTNLYDTTIDALETMQKTEGKSKMDANGNVVLPFLVVFTDGEDNTYAPGALSLLIGNLKNHCIPNFKFKCLVIGSELTTRQLEVAFQVSY